MAEKELIVPDIGDFSEVEIIDILVSEGDTVAVEDPLITLESDKAAMDVPAAQAGTIKTLKVGVGDKVSQGDVIAVLETAAESDTAQRQTQESADQSRPAPATGAAGGPEDVTVPDIGDFKDVEIIDVHVSAGDRVEPEDPLITLESDKAAMDVPAPKAGTVKEVRVKVGDKVSQGDSILTLETGAAAKQQRPQPQAEQASRQTPKPAQPEPRPPPTAPVQVDEKSFAKVHASPSVRRFARELGVDLGKVDGSGRKGRITQEDVQRFVKGVLTAPASAGAAAGGMGIPPIPKVDFSQFGDTETEPLSRIQKISGPHLHRAWLNVPMVTHHDEADVTELEAFRQSLKDEAQKRGVRVTALVFIMKALVNALKAFPRFNASLSSDGESLILKKYYHLGIAVDTPNGLIVPVFRDVDQKTLFELSEELGEVSKRARDGKLTPKDLQGGCMSISSLGGIGGTAFTPLVNAPEVAILGVTRSQMKPVWNGTEFEPRLMLPLDITYDHRVIDGALAARFMTHLCQSLSDIRRLLL